MRDPCDHGASPRLLPASDMLKLTLKLSLLAVLGALLGGCAAPVILGAAGAAGAGTVAVDERDPKTMLDDERIEWKIRGAINLAGLEEDERHHVKVTSFNRIVLLTGQVPDEKAMQRAVAEAGAVARVRGVQNELVVGPPTTDLKRVADTLITGRIKVAMATSDKLQSPLKLNVKVVTEDGAVFLMGLVTREQSEAVTAVVSGIPGVRQIVRLFEFTDAQPSARAGSRSWRAASDDGVRVRADVELPALLPSLQEPGLLPAAEARTETMRGPSAARAPDAPREPS